MDAMLLQQARLAARIRSTYAKVKRDPGAKYFTYVLLLRDSKVYVGCTDNVYTRLMDHCLMSESASRWVKEHGPVQRVLEISRNGAADDEAYKTLEYMSMFGWQNVRGAGYCRTALQAPPAGLAGFKRECTRQFEYLTRAEIEQILGVVRDLARAAPPSPPPGSPAKSA